jgi:hypothetical protein
MTDEMVQNISAAGQSLFAAELLNATASAVDSVFLNAVLESDTDSIITSAGPEAPDAKADLRAALLQLDSHSDVRLYWIASPTVAKKAATLASGANAGSIGRHET